jgi:Plasmid pRiA4b ORF-3-like protein
MNSAGVNTTINAQEPSASPLDSTMAIAAFGWTNSHLYAFTAGGISWGIPDPHFDLGEQPVDARKARLYDIVRETEAKERRLMLP